MQLDIISAAISFVKAELAHNDSSHDWFHIERVWKAAKRLAQEEGLVDSIQVIELGAILHDVKDAKYSGSETAGPDAVRAFLESQKYPQDKINLVVDIVAGVSFKNELGKKPGELRVFPELAVVQDADRLDAIGAIGIARAFCYGGSRNRPMHDPSKPPALDMTQTQYATNNGTTINHFHEKLLKLKDMMKTNAGRRAAQHRHEFMLSFLQEFDLEWEGKA